MGLANGSGGHALTTVPPQEFVTKAVRLVKPLVSILAALIERGAPHAGLWEPAHYVIPRTHLVRARDGAGTWQLVIEHV